MTTQGYCGSQGSIDIPSHEEFSSLSTEFECLSGAIKEQKDINIRLDKFNKELTARLDAVEAELAATQKQLADYLKTKPAKNSSNKHPALKVNYIHTEY
jgi:septal ring factor EnvC (AmiA/AmiB activator)